MDKTLELAHACLDLLEFMNTSYFDSSNTSSSLVIPTVKNYAN